MRLNSIQEVHAPIDYVFGRLTDFASFETYISNIGGSASRTDDLDGTGRGMSWHIEGEFRGKFREVDLELQNISPPEKLKYFCETQTIEAVIWFELEPLGDELTRMNLMMDPTARNISARLILQSVKLAKGTIEKRLSKRLKAFGDQMSNDYRKTLNT